MEFELNKVYEFTAFARTKYSGVYKLTEKVSGKVYIGQSIDLENRLKTHKNKNTFYGNPAGISKILEQKGSHTFTFEILEFTTDLYEREKYYIEIFDACNPEKGFNILPQDKRLSNQLREKTYRETRRNKILRERLEKEDKIISKHN